MDEKVWRKQRPLATGVLDYFGDALLEVAYCSFIGNEQHNPGQPLHWAKEKSTDEPDALLRHLKDRGTLDTDGVRHSAKVAWRALAMLQREIEAERVEPELDRPQNWWDYCCVEDRVPNGIAWEDKSKPACKENYNGWTCTRVKGHSGQHVAGGSETVCAVWSVWS